MRPSGRARGGQLGEARRPVECTRRPAARARGYRLGWRVASAPRLWAGRRRSKHVGRLAGGRWDLARGAAG
jgi:hypothetical protein